MYLVYFEGEGSKRFDDAVAMGFEITNWLDLNPKKSVRVVKYI